MEGFQEISLIEAPTIYYYMSDDALFASILSVQESGQEEMLDVAFAQMREEQERRHAQHMREL